MRVNVPLQKPPRVVSGWVKDLVRLVFSLLPINPVPVRVAAVESLAPRSQGNDACF